MTRISDGALLSELVGAEQASAIAAGFLVIRPNGGRVWVDEHGHAVTLVGEQLVYLGPLSAESVAPPAPGGSDLRSSVVRALLSAPGSTARELAFTISRSGTAVSKSHVNSLLYRDSATFTSDGGTVPRWRVIAERASAPELPVRRGVQPKVRGRAVARDAYADLVEAPRPDSGTPFSTHAERSARVMPTQVLDLMKWQQEAMHAWYGKGCHGIIEAVTGTGKTHLGLEAVAHAARQGQKSIVLVPSVDLQDQWMERFTTFLPDLAVARVGGRKSGNPQHADVTLAVVNSALRRPLDELSSDSLIVADEVHRYGAEQFQYALKPGYVRRLGLTATLERSGDDAVEAVLSPYFGGTIMKVGFDRAIRENVVAPFRLILAPVSLNQEEQDEYDKFSHQISKGLKVLRGAGALKGDGNVVQQLGRLRAASGEIGRAARIAESGMRHRRHLLAGLSAKLDAIEELAEAIEDSNGTVIFTQSKEVAEDAAAALREWDIPASALHSDMTDKERRASLAGLASGELRALAAPKLLDEGIDVPTVDLGIVMTASRSRRQMVQRLGRVIRRKDDGRPVNFVLLYAKDTVEDPESGVHEGFFDLVGEVATNRIVLEPGWDANDLPRLQR